MSELDEHDDGIDSDSAAGREPVPDEPIPVCATCGEEMEPVATGNDQVIEEPGDLRGVVGAGWECGNVNCPEHPGETELAPAADRQ